MAKVLFAPNVPVTIAVKYADVVPSQYGPELRLKGSTPDDPSAICYAPWEAACTSLVACGALAGVPAVPDPLPEKGFALKLAAKELVVTKVQAAGEKHGTVTVSKPGAAPHPIGRPGRVSDAVQPTPRDTAPAAAGRKPLTAVYLECTDFALAQVAKRYQGAGVPFDAAAAVAAANTLFVARTREEGR